MNITDIWPSKIGFSIPRGTSPEEILAAITFLKSPHPAPRGFVPSGRFSSGVYGYFGDIDLQDQTPSSSKTPGSSISHLRLAVLAHEKFLPDLSEAAAFVFYVVQGYANQLPQKLILCIQDPENENPENKVWVLERIGFDHQTTFRIYEIKFSEITSDMCILLITPTED